MDAEIIELSNLEDFGVGEYPSSNFGSGIEFLMNDKKKEGSKNYKSEIGMDDLNELEKELNSFESSTQHVNKSDIFSAISDDHSPHKVNFVDQIPFVGTKAKDEKSWDGYSKFNDIPLNPDKQMPSEQKFTRDERLREKFKLLKKLETLEKKESN